MNISELLVELKQWFGATKQKPVKRLPAPQSYARQLVNNLCFVVDDEIGIRQLISTTLKPMGVQIEEFGSAQSLIEGMGRRRPLLTFLDVSLDRSDAVEALRGLAKIEYSGAIILISGRHGQILEDIRMIGERIGLRMLSALVKPFDVATIRAIGSTHFKQVAKTAPRIGIDEALQRGWMQVWYQPKIDLQRKILVGCEALARINHPEHGILLPGTFLPNANADALKHLTEHVLLTVLRDCSKFKNVGAGLQPAINVPVDVLLNFPLAALVRENRPKDDAWQGLIVEVTEDQIIREIALAQEIATHLKIYDIALAIDDFGAGYSSLSRLKVFPFVELKLDYSFVKDCSRNPQNAGICKAVIDLAHSFDTLAVAEGIEQPEDLRALFQMGCDVGQGYLFAAPMPVEKFVKVLEQRNTVQKAER